MGVAVGTKVDVGVAELVAVLDGEGVRLGRGEAVTVWVVIGANDVVPIVAGWLVLEAHAATSGIITANNAMPAANLMVGEYFCKKARIGCAVSLIL